MEWHRVWKVGAGVDTDTLAPGAYMKLPIEQMAQHALEANYPGLAQRVGPGDALVAGDSFGIGSSREQAVGVLVALGVRMVVAPSFSGLYFRNAYNLGLLAIVCKQADDIPEGSHISLDMGQTVLHVKGRIDDASVLFSLPVEPVPDFLLRRARMGGLLNELEERFQRMRKE